MSEMVERVALAIAKLTSDSAMKHNLAEIDQSDQFGAWRALYPVKVSEHDRALARAAIEAMREPTQEMRLAGIAEWTRPDPTPEHESTLVFNALWRAMLDGALKS